MPPSGPRTRLPGPGPDGGLRAPPVRGRPSMTYPPRPHTPTGRTRPSGRRRPPADVVDVLLWQLAIDVAAAHRLDHDGNCTNLACAGLRGRCSASRHAERALQLARRRPDHSHHRAPADRSQTEPAIGRAVVTTARSASPAGSPRRKAPRPHGRCVPAACWPGGCRERRWQPPERQPSHAHVEGFTLPISAPAPRQPRRDRTGRRSHPGPIRQAREGTSPSAHKRDLATHSRCRPLTAPR